MSALTFLLVASAWPSARPRLDNIVVKGAPLAPEAPRLRFPLPPEGAGEATGLFVGAAGAGSAATSIADMELFVFLFVCESFLLFSVTTTDQEFISL